MSNATTTIGDIEVIALTDGSGQFDAGTFPETDPAHIESLMAAAGVETIDTNFNAFVLRSGDATVLVDAGPRDLFGPTAGNLMDGLNGAGIGADAITHLAFTHMHPDHIAGAITADGQAVFANAQVLLPQTEFDFWTNAGNFTSAPDMLKDWQKLSDAVLAAYAGRATPIADDGDIISGATFLPLPGHTPGHCGVRVSAGNASFVHVGDIVHAQSLQLTDPEVSVAFDIDMETARATRKRTLDMLATDQIPFSGGHIITPKIGLLEAAGSGFRMVEG